jgi:hypothetical protein
MRARLAETRQYSEEDFTKWFAVYASMPRPSYRKLAKQLGVPLGTIQAVALRRGWIARMRATTSPQPPVETGDLHSGKLAPIIIRMLETFRDDLAAQPGAQVPHGLTQLFDSYRRALSAERRWAEKQPDHTEPADLSRLTDLQLRALDIITTIVAGGAELKDAAFLKAMSEAPC